ncbi:hypothetical protein SAMN05878482_11079 [Peribacillus simplex]|uniref:Uncharacterized protein n=1 Tax=Peribacillus simplex TaxID=1478 RepID=A0A9X8RDX9_9BACI|nr:hypothetical protein [Peribacillus simplex]SIS04217.1 hypothetical protein SAMN05878482_11079 [Peribacillus simplex]
MNKQELIKLIESIETPEEKVESFFRDYRDYRIDSRRIAMKHLVSTWGHLPLLKITKHMYQ